MDFDIDDARRIKGARERDLLAVLDYHHREFTNSIKQSYAKFEDSCTYCVIPFVSRLPAYDAAQITRMLEARISSDGIRVSHIGDNRLVAEFRPKPRPDDHIPFLLNMLSRQIRDVAGNNRDYAFFEVPSILPEFPWYDACHTAETMGKIIESNGFEVRIMKNMLYVSWAEPGTVPRGPPESPARRDPAPQHHHQQHHQHHQQPEPEPEPTWNIPERFVINIANPDVTRI